MGVDMFLNGAGSLAPARGAGGAAPDAESRRAAEPRGRDFASVVDEAVSRRDGGRRADEARRRQADVPAIGEPARHQEGVDTEAEAPAAAGEATGPLAPNDSMADPPEPGVTVMEAALEALDETAPADASEKGMAATDAGGSGVVRSADLMSESSSADVVSPDTTAARAATGTIDGSTARTAATGPGIDASQAVPASTEGAAPPTTSSGVVLAGARDLEAEAPPSPPLAESPSMPAESSDMESEPAARLASEARPQGPRSPLPGLAVARGAGTAHDVEGDVDGRAATAREGSPGTVAGGGDSSARSDAIRLIAEALREGRGAGNPGHAPSGRLEVFGQELRRAIEAVLPAVEGGGRSQASWLRIVHALSDAPGDDSPAPNPDVLPGAPPLAAGSSTQASTAVAGAARVAPAPEADVGEQIVQGLRLQWRNGAGEARLHLRPDHLGALDVALKVVDGAVRALVRAESPAMQEWILRNRDDLKAALQAQGLTLEELDVVVDPDDRRRRSHGEAEPRPLARRGTGAASGERTFEVRV